MEIDWLWVLMGIGVFIIGAMMYTCQVNMSEACDDFGGKLSGNNNCIKDGVSYDMETKGQFTSKYQVVRKAVDINDAVYTEGEQDE